MILVAAAEFTFWQNYGDINGSDDGFVFGENVGNSNGNGNGNGDGGNSDVDVVVGNGAQRVRCG